MKNIKHIVYLMLENRSLDNVLGWLYQHNNPLEVFPAGSSPVYNGLQTGNYYTIDKQGNHHPVRPYSGKELIYPTEDPNEEFNHVNNQLWGRLTNPPAGQIPPMLGFYIDYMSQNSQTDEIMYTYMPQSAAIINALAARYAVSDTYFSSLPTQTNCNRAFAATGNSIGMLNGKMTSMVNNYWGVDPDGHDWDPAEFSYRTIWNVLVENNFRTPADWSIYYNQTWPGHGLGDFCFTQDLFWPNLRQYGNHFKGIDQFYADAKNNNLPRFSFLEPAWYEEEFGIGANGSDYHPPDNMKQGENFLLRIFSALSTSPAWENTLLIINFDEHGGTYDHVPPPWSVPAPWKNPADGIPKPDVLEHGFECNRLGVRVPLILISPQVPQSSVFRPQKGGWFDHTSVIASVLEHFQIPRTAWKMGTRTVTAPTFNYVVNNPAPLTDIPELPVPEKQDPVPDTQKPNDLQWMVVRRMVVRHFSERNIPMEKRPLLYKKHFGQVQTMKQLNGAIRAIREETV